MTPAELTTARIALGYDKVVMAQALKTPYPTYRDWERGHRRIPGVCEVAVSLLLGKDQAFMNSIKMKPHEK